MGKREKQKHSFAMKIGSIVLQNLQNPTVKAQKNPTVNAQEGRGVWESNPPGTPLRRPPTVLKTATVTGPQTPPSEDRREDHQSMMQKVLLPATHVFQTLLHHMGGNQCVCPMRPLPISMPYMVSHHKRSAGTARNTISSPSGVEAEEACGGLCFCQKTSKTFSER
jgi:hypothetical protein